MKEKHFAYKIKSDAAGLVCTYAEIEKNKMLDLLQLVQKDHEIGLYWVFKQLDNQPKEPLCIIDCSQKRVYYHYSGDVEDLDDTIKKLSK
ncbi:Uncharacterised protein [Legionella beliardensis]|uniref:Uncharacterized protein n=1 Tax=Legionella beliardensis TaxID=91822 RepID=A0A378I5R0_9GAMM|nr:hypothetical protein [Legionella beliardensis]STX30055.1 Uncharacterised protein [Legionella beliardensis]